MTSRTPGFGLLVPSHFGEEAAQETLLAGLSTDLLNTLLNLHDFDSPIIQNHLARRVNCIDSTIDSRWSALSRG